VPPGGKKFIRRSSRTVGVPAWRELFAELGDKMELHLRDDDSIRAAFLNWQCRLRKRVLREQGGRPSPGMRPSVTLRDGRQISSAITVLLADPEPGATAAMLRHVCRKSQDPQRRYDEGLRFLSSSYYQYPENFSGDLTAVFSADSFIAEALLIERFCVLRFEEFPKGFQTPCEAQELDQDAAAYQMTYWHNFLFNPVLPPQVRILVFHPDWTQAAGLPAHGG
jgi:hypothetical protein